jgi:hypothetical protein
MTTGGAAVGAGMADSTVVVAAGGTAVEIGRAGGVVTAVDDVAVGVGGAGSTVAVGSDTAVGVDGADSVVMMMMMAECGSGALIGDGCAAAATAGADASGMAVHGMSLDVSEISKQRMTGGVEPWCVSQSDTAGDSGAGASAVVGAGDAIERGGGRNEQKNPLHWC